jgi:hypothetical protein
MIDTNFLTFYKSSNGRISFISAYDMSTPTLRLRQSEAQKNVCRLRNCMPEKFQTLVRMHLSFLLDLDGDKLDNMFSGTKVVDRVEQKKCKSSTPFYRKKSK